MLYILDIMALLFLLLLSIYALPYVITLWMHYLQHPHHSLEEFTFWYNGYMEPFGTHYFDMMLKGSWLFVGGILCYFFIIIELTLRVIIERSKSMATYITLGVLAFSYIVLSQFFSLYFATLEYHYIEQFSTFFNSLLS